MLGIDAAKYQRPSRVARSAGQIDGQADQLTAAGAYDGTSLCAPVVARFRLKITVTILRSKNVITRSNASREPIGHDRRSSRHNASQLHPLPKET